MSEDRQWSINHYVLAGRTFLNFFTGTNQPAMWQLLINFI